MSTRVARFVYLERGIVGYLEAQLGDPSVSVIAGELPEPFTATEAGQGVVQVIQAPGGEPGDGITTQPLVDLHVFAADYGRMWDVTAEVVNAMRALGGQAALPGGQLVDTVHVRQTPAFQAWSREVPRTVSVYQIDLRPVPSS